MSSEAIRWAFNQDCERPFDKLVLWALGHCHHVRTGVCFPSQVWIMHKTGIDRKTLRECLQRLEDGGWISDTGRREGPTRSVKVYRLNMPAEGQGDLFGEGSPKTDHLSMSENGPAPSTGKPIRKRTTLPNGEACPFFPPSVSENGPLSVSENGHEKVQRETRKESSNSISGKPPKKSTGKARANPYPKPPDVTDQTWEDYLAVRKRKGKPNTSRAHERLMRDLEAIAADTGATHEAIILQSAELGWVGVFTIKEGYDNGRGNTDRGAYPASSDPLYERYQEILEDERRESRGEDHSGTLIPLPPPSR